MMDARMEQDADDEAERRPAQPRSHLSLRRTESYVPVLQLSGELAGCAAHDLKAALIEQLVLLPPLIVLDLSALVSIDGGGAWTVLHVAELAQRADVGMTKR